MPTVSPVQSTDVRAAIARAADRTGVDFDYLLAQAKLESGLNPQAKARTSSATGLYQFIDSTWLRTVDRHGSKHGMEWADRAIGISGRVDNPALRAQIMSLRYDADTSSLMAAELARENAQGLKLSLGREPQPAELYLAHFLGLGGAQQFLGALESNPHQSAAALMPRAAGANRPIFYAGNRPRSVGEVMTLMENKVGAAYGDTSANTPAITGPQPSAGYAAPPRYHPVASGAPAPLAAAQVPARPSMSETLKHTFGGNDPVARRATENVAAAYGKLRAFGL